MNAKQFREKYAVTECKRICLAAGTTYGYFQHLCTGERKPSIELAKRLEKVTKGELKAVDLLGLSE